MSASGRPEPSVAVVGGGFAGLAAAVALQEGRCRVTLLERRGVLGGRAASYTDAATGDEVDTGLHFLTQGCSAGLDLLRRSGASDLLHPPGTFPLRLQASGGSLAFGEAGWGPPALAAVAALLGLPLPWSMHRQAFRLLPWLRRERGNPAASLAERLAAAGQATEARRLLWDPLSALLFGLPPEDVADAPAARLVRELLLGPEGACRWVLPRRGWSRLLDRVARYFEARGGRVRRRALVQAVTLRDGRARSLRLLQRAETRDAIRRGVRAAAEELAAEAVVLAVPWRAVPALLPAELRGSSPFPALAALPGASHVKVELWLDRRVLGPGLVLLAASDLACVVDTGRLHGSTRAGQRLGCSVRPELTRASRPASEWASLAEAALRERLPAMREARTLRSVVLREADGSFPPDPVSQALRPGAETPVRGLFLAGDWTDTGLPSCIEGAVRSGRSAARRALGYLRGGDPPA